MNSQVDWNQIIAQVFIDLTKSAAKNASNKFSSALTSILHSFQRDLNPYLVSTLKRNSTIRTLLHRDEPVPLSSIYVKTYLKHGKRKIDDLTFIQDLSKVENALIIGTAGSGKSIFLKYLFTALFEQRRSKVPLFIELRQMNSMQTRDLILFMYHSVVTPGGVITQDQFLQALREGLFTIILDGFDEVEFDWRPELEKQLFKVLESCPKNQFLITSRPDDRFSGWHNFSIFHIQPMSKKEVLSLIRKIDYEPDVKKRFTKAIRGGMYEKHVSFLSTPLLAIMMLLTFDQFASIPDKIHVFYDHAFDALFAKHDASKQGGYRRRSRTGLAIDDFKRCLSAFCAATYAKGKIVLSESETRSFLAQAFKFEKQNVNADDFIHDLIESVCVLQRDGLFLTFSHRSFQEYFAAYFVCRSPAVDLSRMLDQIMWKYTDFANVVRHEPDSFRTRVDFTEIDALKRNDRSDSTRKNIFISQVVFR
jgi:predicted NACHT family NTPase